MSSSPIDALHRRATALGVSTGYEDVDGEWQTTDPGALSAVVETLARDLDARTQRGPIEPVFVGVSRIPVVGLSDAELRVDGVVQTLTVEPATPGASEPSAITIPADLPVGCHPLRVSTAAGDADSLVVVPPASMPGLDATRRWSSLFVPAYALWTHARPLPSFGHLQRAAQHAERHGVDMIATLPLYATFLDEPFDPSPYSPISRLHWNETYLDDASLPPADGDPADVVETLDGVSVIGWRTLGTRRRAQLETLAASLPPDLATSLDEFAQRRPDAVDFARFMASRRVHAGSTDLVRRSHLVAQMLCEEQLAPLADGRLSLDLPIGSHPDGYEVWAQPELFAPATTVGAPPDGLFRGGQNWGFPPQLPGAMRASGYALWRSLIQQAGRFTKLLRIDHVMAVHRLWWIPDGFDAIDGVYVTYPCDELLAVIAATAAATGTAVVGENLGIVPPEVDEALDEWQMMGMHEEQFHMQTPVRPSPELAVAGIRTHDMDSFAAHVSARRGDAGFVDYLRAIGADPTDPLDGVLRHLAAGEARMVVADLDDLIGERRPHNRPGRVVPGIWQRRLDQPIDDVFGRPDVSRRLGVLGARRRRHPRSRRRTSR